MEEETVQEQPVSEEAHTIMDAQDQQAEQAFELATTGLEHRLEDTENREHKLVALAVRLAAKAGLRAGIGLDPTTEERFAAIDLLGGQVWWPMSDEEVAWLEGVPLYDKPLDALTDDVRYQRVLAGL